MSSDVNFSIKLAYQYLSKIYFLILTLFSPWLTVNQVLKGLELIFKNFVKIALLIIDERNIRHMTNNATCCQCGAQKETIMHLLRDCYHIQEVWDPSIK